MFFTNLQSPGKSLFPGYCHYLTWLRGHLKKKQLNAQAPKPTRNIAKCWQYYLRLISRGANKNLIVNLKGNPGKINGHRKFWKSMRLPVYMYYVYVLCICTVYMYKAMWMTRKWGRERGDRERNWSQSPSGPAKVGNES